MLLEALLSNPFLQCPFSFPLSPSNPCIYNVGPGLKVEGVGASCVCYCRGLKARIGDVLKWVSGIRHTYKHNNACGLKV